jgi:hypothetical protein
MSLVGVARRLPSSRSTRTRIRAWLNAALLLALFPSAAAAGDCVYTSPSGATLRLVQDGGIVGAEIEIGKTQFHCQLTREMLFTDGPVWPLPNDASCTTGDEVEVAMKGQFAFIDPAEGHSKAALIFFNGNAFYPSEGCEVEPLLSPGLPLAYPNNMVATEAKASGNRPIQLPTRQVPSVSVGASGQVQPNPSQLPATSPKTIKASQALVFRPGDPVMQVRDALYGTVTWGEDKDRDGQPVLTGFVSLPTANLDASIRIAKNVSPGIRATNIMELKFLPHPGFIGGAIAKVQDIHAKDRELARGTLLMTAATSVPTNDFLVAFDNIRPDSQTNIDLFAKLDWVDLRLVDAAGKDWLLILGKDGAGPVFSRILAEWGQ